MKTTRFRLAAVAGIAIGAIALSGCSGDSSDASANGDDATIDAEHSAGAMENFAAGDTFKATEPVEFSLMYRDHPNYPVQEDWSILQNIEKNNNVTFDRTDIPLADFDAKKALLIGSGEATDIISVTYAGQETQYVSGGAVVPVSDYFDYMPNFQQKIKDWGLQEELDTHRQEDGKIYILPGLREVPDVQYSVIINETMWDKAGITEDPTTWDEYLEDLVKVTEANSEIAYGMSDRWTDSSTLGAFLQTAAPSFDTVAGWGYANSYFNQKSGEFEFTGTTDGYKDLVSYAAGLVSSGALDPDITQSDDQAVQKFISGESSAISGNTQMLADYRSKLADAGKSDVTIRMINVPGGPAGSNLTGSRFTSGIMIGSDAVDQPYFKALLQFVDWLYFSDEGIEFAQWGVEGETYTKDADGVRTLESNVGWSALNPDAEKQLNADFGYSNGVFMFANGSSAELTQSMMTDEIADWTAAQLDAKTVLPVTPAAQLNDIELEQITLLDTQLKDAVATATAAFITGQKSIDADWDSYVSQMQSLGADQLIDTFNTALKRASK
ncbi:ABC transporter substrate-binding protein [Microbacterium sp. A93]|uniref:ABC transporter substrate-binding protein n=1 Tax=Microbacterium sp. A93 TaxID=3450716 RepID=UPI003F43340F